MYSYMFRLSHNFASGGIFSLGVDPKLLILQVLSFALIFWILKRFAFSPIITALDDRYNKIEGSIKHAEALEKANDEAAKDAEELLRKSRAEAEKIISRSHEDAGAIIEEAELRAEKTADKFLATARKELEQDALKMRAGIKGEIVELVGNVTEAIILEKVDTPKDKQLIDKALQEVAGR